MAGFENKVSASGNGFSVRFGFQCCVFPDDQNIQKETALSE
jgi:hypothetical protein